MLKKGVPVHRCTDRCGGGGHQDSAGEMVLKFAMKYGAPIAEEPTFADDIVLQRAMMMREEVEEYLGALDLVSTAHELGDIVYVAYGTAIALGIPLDDVISEIHRANMTKTGGTNSDGKVQKGEGYKAPDIANILSDYMTGRHVTDAELQAVRTADYREALDLVRSLWVIPYGSAGERLSVAEAAILDVSPSLRYLRLATGGWPGNEAIIDAFSQNRAVWALTHCLTKRGGLYIFEYPLVSEG